MKARVQFLLDAGTQDDHDDEDAGLERRPHVLRERVLLDIMETRRDHAEREGDGRDANQDEGQKEQAAEHFTEHPPLAHEHLT